MRRDRRPHQELRLIPFARHLADVIEVGEQHIAQRAIEPEVD